MTTTTTPAWMSQPTTVATCTRCNRRDVLGSRTTDGAPLCGDCTLTPAADPEITDADLLADVLLRAEFEIGAVFLTLEQAVAGRPEDDTNAIKIRALAAALRAVAHKTATTELI